MNRYTKAKRRDPALRPVERVEVSEKHVGLRFAAFGLCLLVGMGALGFWLYSLLSTEPGWVDVEIATDQIHCGGQFTFRYLTGKGELSPSAELRQVRNVYTQAAIDAYQLFSTVEELENVHNIWYINNHPNEDIEVDPALYHAIQLVEERDEQEEWRARWLYFGLVNNVYDDLFFCRDDAEARRLDPLEDPEMFQFWGELVEFACDPDQVDLKLLGDNTLRLEVSEEYQQYAQDVGRTQYIDFGWMRNAFIADYFANRLNQAGFYNGVIASYDGFTRALGGDIGGQVFNVYGWEPNQSIVLCQTEFEQPVNMANLRAFPLSEQDKDRMYVYEDGTVRSAYEAVNWPVRGSIAMYSPSMECGELALRAGAAFIGSDLHGVLPAVRQEGVETIYASPGDGVVYTEPGREFLNGYKHVEIRPFGE